MKDLLALRDREHLSKRTTLRENEVEVCSFLLHYICYKLSLSAISNDLRIVTCCCAQCGSTNELKGSHRRHAAATTAAAAVVSAAFLLPLL